jgi:hypothetical protein
VIFAVLILAAVWILDIVVFMSTAISGTMVPSF